MNVIDAVQASPHNKSYITDKSTKFITQMCSIYANIKSIFEIKSNMY